MKKRYDVIREAGDKISSLVAENLAAFQANIDTEIWKAYIEYLDEMVVEGFFQCIHCSLHYMLSSTDIKQVQCPLFEARLELQAPDMVFVPSLDLNVNGGFYDIIEDILLDVYQQSSLVKRLASHYEHPDYQVCVKCFVDCNQVSYGIM